MNNCHMCHANTSGNCCSKCGMPTCDLCLLVVALAADGFRDECKSCVAKAKAETERISAYAVLDLIWAIFCAVSGLALLIAFPPARWMLVPCFVAMVCIGAWKACKGIRGRL